MKIPDTFCLLVTGTYVTLASSLSAPKYEISTNQVLLFADMSLFLAEREPLERIILPFAKT